MRIDSSQYVPLASSTTAKSATSILDAARTAASGESNASTGAGTKTADFTSMTRQELFDWMNASIRSGEMTLDESTPFLGMTLKMSALTGEPVDMATDSERINFMDRARQGIEGALWFHDLDFAERLQTALDQMQQLQGQVLGLDTLA